MILTGIEWGSVADWVGVFCTTSAVVLALWQSFFGIQRDQRITEKRKYSKNLVTSIISLKSMVNDLEELFITEFHPEARRSWELDGSDVDTITKSSSELKSDIFIIIKEMDRNLKLANIDNFINNLQQENSLNEVKKTRENMIDLFKSIQNTEGVFAITESGRKSYETHDMLDDTEQRYYDGTISVFDKSRKDLKKLEKAIINTF